MEEVYRPVRPRHKLLDKMGTLMTSSLIGRERERRLLMQAAVRLVRGVGGGLVVVEGPAGIGK